MFARANAVLGFGANGSYTIKGHLRVVFNQPLEGTLMKAVSEPEVWRSEITLPGYSEVVVRNGERSWIRRSTDFTPLQVRELVTALQPHLKVSEKEKVEKVTVEVVRTTRAKCVKLKMKEWDREVCMDATTGLPLLTKSSWGRREQVDYEGYSAVGGRQFPTNIRVTEAGKLVAEFTLDSVSLDMPDKSLFDPLPDAVAWPVCDESKIKPPVPISTPDPDYPEVERRNRVQGIVVVQALIDEHGQTHDVVVVRSLNPRLDGEAKAAVLKWRFQPAMCGSTPIPKEMSIEVAFRLY